MASIGMDHRLCVDDRAHARGSRLGQELAQRASSCSGAATSPLAGRRERDRAIGTVASSSVRRRYRTRLGHRAHAGPVAAPSPSRVSRALVIDVRAATRLRPARVRTS